MVSAPQPVFPALLAALVAAAVASCTEAAAYTEATAAQPSTLELEEVASDVYAVIQPSDRRFADANSLLVACETSGALLVDPPSDPERLAALVDEIRRRGWTVGAVVSTHWHGDHTQGTAAIVDAFGEDVERIGHETLTEDVPARAAGAHRERVELYEREIPAARDRLERRVRRDGSPLAEDDVAAARDAIERAEAWLDANRDARFLPPTVTYRSRMALERCGRRIELLHFRAHTRGDTVVRFPAEGVVASGDLLDDLPYVGHGHPRSWVATLDEIDGWNAELFVPGHGPIFRGEDKLEAVRGYLRDLIALTDRAHAEGASLEKTQSTVDLSRWRTELAGEDEGARRFFDQTVGEAIARAFEESLESENGSTDPPP